MPDKFDPYRESLVMEQTTVWPEDVAIVDGAQRVEFEQALHSDPESCSHLEYVRVHTGFCRQITVTQADVDRLASG